MEMEQMKKAVVIILNILVIIAMISYAVLFSFSQQESSVQSEKKAFTSTVEVMEQVSSNYLLSCQNICDNWASYVESGKYTMPEAMEQIMRMNTDENISIQLLKAENLSGLSSVAKQLNAEDYTVTYTEKYSTLYDELRAFADSGASDSGIHVTRNFNNPVNGDFVVAFCQQITLYDENGAYRALLLYIDQLSQFRERWVFPVGYSDAQIAMIDSDGEYIIRADSMKSENFYEFIRTYNDLTYPQSDALRAQVNAGDTGGFGYLNAGKQQTYYAYTHLGGGNWLLVGSIPLKDLSGASMQWSLIAVICCGFLALLFLNVAYFLFLNRKLAASLTAAESASRAKTEFLSSMSHDIRTPMNAIVGMTAIARRSVDNPAQVGDCLTKISLASDHLLTLINDILDLSRVESGKLRLNPTEFSLAEAVQNLVNIMYPAAADKQLRFEVYLDKIKRERLVADELRLSQIWINILSNAIKYTGSGGSVTVSLREENADDGKILLVYRVADNGIGMSAEFKKTIFDAFTRATDSRINEIQGSGLGMTITKQMTDLMGGDIQVESELGKGSVFTVTLPLKAAAGEPEEKTFPGLAVLIMDADSHVVSSARSVFSEMCITAESASDLQQAIDLTARRRAERNGFDVIFIGSNFPETQSTACIAALREAAGSDQTKIIVASYDYAGLSEAERAAGADGHIVKPCFRTTLREKLDEMIDPENSAKIRKPERNYAGLRLLVAEDNDLNWEIIDELLSYYGIVPERAENGRVCVDMLENAEVGRYQMIFMDIQMPVMNGLEATRAIRALPDAEKARIPIIAMTADAFAEDVEKCRSAGMNGHVAKPLSIDRVLAEIDRFRRKEEKK
jgi:two-component system sensor histidine kinase/response regulator